jgi:hypothetical protein
VSAQSLSALGLAQVVKQERRDLRARVSGARPAAGSRHECAAVLEEASPALDRLRVWTLLAWCYRLYERDVPGLLRAAGIAGDFRLVGELTGRQRAALVEALREGPA